MVLVLLAFLIKPVYSSSERSQSIILGNSGKPLSILDICRGSPNFCNLSVYLSPPTSLPTIVGSQTLARVILRLYYLYNTTYIFNLNLIIYRSSTGFEPGSPGRKAATLPLCHTPLTRKCFLPGVPSWLVNAPSCLQICRKLFPFRTILFRAGLQRGH